jgi:hypothetical protein
MEEVVGVVQGPLLAALPVLGVVGALLRVTLAEAAVVPVQVEDVVG